MRFYHCLFIIYFGEIRNKNTRNFSWKFLYFFRSLSGRYAEDLLFHFIIFSFIVLFVVLLNYGNTISNSQSSSFIVFVCQINYY